MSKGILWSFGDSFTAGNAKTVSHGIQYPFTNTVGKKRAYPFLLADKLDMTSVNLAVGGSDNNAIFEELVNAFSNIDMKRDFTIIALSTPFRGNPNRNPQHVLKDLHQVLGNIEVLMRGYKYIITSAFCPLIPGYFTKEDLNYDIKNYVEWGKQYNTLLDICCGTWLQESEVEIIKQNEYLSGYELGKFIKEKNTLEDCGHPNNLGHQEIAKTLLPYIEKFLHKKNGENLI